MWVQPFRTAELQQTVPPKAEAEPRVAVLLNANAHRVTERVVRQLSHAVPQGDLYVSRSELDCRRIAQAVLDRRYHTVFTGGGDGTFMGFANEILNQLDVRRRHHHQATAPRFGVLKLGTGNALAAVVKASSARGDGILDDVLRARAGEVPGYRAIDLLMVDGKRAPFAGLGLDGKLLNDYIWLKKNVAKGMLHGLMTGGTGYFTSIALKTVPHYLTHSTFVDCEIENLGVTAYRLGPDGLPRGEGVPKGGIMYRGELMMAAAGTIPCLGYGMRMFPFAGKRKGMMHLRIGALPTTSILANLPKLWAGQWQPEGMFDFHCSDVRIKFARPMPLQVSGDAEGYRDEVRFSMANEPVELIDFNGALN